MSMIPIASSTVGAGGVSSVTFSSIPSTFTHLQLRGFVQTNRSTYGISEYYLQFNDDNVNTNYREHGLYGDGSGVTSFSNQSLGTLFDFNGTAGTSTGGTFGNTIIDILDYANTNKNKVARAISGVDINGTIAGFGGRCGIFSGVWLNTSAVTKIVLISATPLFTQGTRFDLYGITNSPATGA